MSSEEGETQFSANSAIEAAKPSELSIITDARVNEYGTYLKDKYRPPSKGGNTRAWHQHVLTVAGEKYSFLALGARKWVFASDTVRFQWAWNATKIYRNVIAESIEVRDKGGHLVTRGERGSKKWRTADARMPASRREQRD